MVVLSRKKKKFCQRCGKGTVKPDRVACKRCGSTEWGDNATVASKQNAPAQPITPMVVTDVQNEIAPSQLIVPMGAGSNHTSNQAVTRVRFKDWRRKGGCLSSVKQCDVYVTLESGKEVMLKEGKRYNDFGQLKCIVEEYGRAADALHHFPPKYWWHSSTRLRDRLAKLERFVNELLRNKNTLDLAVAAHLELFLDVRLAKPEPAAWLLDKRRPEELEPNECEECGRAFRKFKAGVRFWSSHKHHCLRCHRVFCEKCAPKRQGVLTKPRQAVTVAGIVAAIAAAIGGNVKQVAGAAGLGAVAAPVLGPSTHAQRKCTRCYEDEL